MKKIFVVGDSISMQYGPYLEEFLKGEMAYARKEGDADALLNLDEPIGANGGDSMMVVKYLRAMNDAGGIDADLLLVNCGLHDIKTDVETSAKQVALLRYRINLAAIVKLVDTMQPQLIWIRTTPVDDAIHNRPESTFHRFATDCEAYNAAADQIMAEAGVPIIDLYSFTRSIGADLYYDHVHFHDHICQHQAAFIAGWLHHYVADQSKPLPY